MFKRLYDYDTAQESILSQVIMRKYDIYRYNFLSRFKEIFYYKDLQLVHC